MWEYRATLNRVVDADTLELIIDLGFSVYTNQHIRIINLNSPESNTPEGREAIAYSNNLFEEVGTEVTVRTEYDRSFARYLGHVRLADGEDYATVMRVAGHGE